MRCKAVGVTDDGRILAVVYTLRYTLREDRYPNHLCTKVTVQ